MWYLCCVWSWQQCHLGHKSMPAILDMVLSFDLRRTNWQRPRRRHEQHGEGQHAICLTMCPITTSTYHEQPCQEPR